MYNLIRLQQSKLDEIMRNERLSKYVDIKYKIPKSYRGKGQIKLIILGQDPTVRDLQKRSSISTVLNLDKRGSLRCYILEICNKLGILLDEDVYATNYFKNFFIKPPTQIADSNIFLEFSNAWSSVLYQEIEEFPNIPVLTLGEPLLSVLANDNKSKKVKSYWGYSREWRQAQYNAFTYLKCKENILNRVILPFPHLPSISKEFYKNRFESYCDFIKATKLI